GLRRGAVGEIGMIDVLFLQRLQRDSRFPQDLVLPGQKLGAKIIALPVVHERLFFGGSIILQLFQGQPIFICKANERFRSRAPYIAAPCDRQYRWVVVPRESEALPQGLPHAGLSGPRHRRAEATPSFGRRWRAEATPSFGRLWRAEARRSFGRASRLYPVNRQR